MGGDKTVRDEIIVFEVLTETLEKAWWTSYRRRLETDFQQAKIIVRASAVTLLPRCGRWVRFGRPVRAPLINRAQAGC